MTPTTLYHNPRCSKSREALKLLQDAGESFVQINYLEQPPLPGHAERAGQDCGYRVRRHDPSQRSRQDRSLSSRHARDSRRSGLVTGAASRIDGTAARGDRRPDDRGATTRQVGASARHWHHDIAARTGPNKGRSDATFPTITGLILHAPRGLARSGELQQAS